MVGQMRLSRSVTTDRFALVLAVALLTGCATGRARLPTPGVAPPGWQLVWADEFDGDAIDQESWTAELMPDPYNEELQYYTERVDGDRGANAWLVCMKHARQKPEPPSARSRRPVPADLEQVILDCLAKRPDLRPAGAAELADRLAACADAGGWTPERASQWWREHAEQLAPSDEGADAVQALSVDLADRKTPPRETSAP